MAEKLSRAYIHDKILASISLQICACCQKLAVWKAPQGKFGDKVMQ